jgi:hypothetical protein
MIHFLLSQSSLVPDFVCITVDTSTLSLPLYPPITPCVQKLLIWPSSARGMGLHTRSTSLTLSSSLCVKGLTRRCYVWNDKAYKLALTLINFRCGNKPTNSTLHVPLGLHGPTSSHYYRLLMGLSVTFTPLRADALDHPLVHPSTCTCGKGWCSNIIYNILRPKTTYMT